jgi:hypothetical protein
MTSPTGQTGVEMPDTRLPDHWLAAPQFDGLSDSAWRIFTHGYMWSNRNLTDGWIPNKSLKHLGTVRGSDGLLELEEACLVEVSEGAIYLDWEFQTTRETFLKQKEDNRKKTAQKRAKDRERLADAESTQVSTPVTHSVGRRGQEEDEGIRYSSDADDEVF